MSTTYIVGQKQTLNLGSARQWWHFFNSRAFWKSNVLSPNSKIRHFNAFLLNQAETWWTIVTITKKIRTFVNS